MYLKTNDEDAAEHLCVPSTRYELDHTQPDFVLLRVVAKSLILWDSVRPTRKWVESNCPKLLKRSARDLDRGYIKTNDATKRSNNSGGDDVGIDEDDDDEQPRSFREGPDREAEAQARVHAIAGRVFPWDFDMRALRTRRRLIRCATTAYSFSSGRKWL